MSNEVRVAGVGMIPFTKPGASETYNVMGEKAAAAAFKDAGLPYAAVQQVYVGYVYGDSTAGQAAVYGLGLSGVPIINVNNNCSTGSSALFLARQAVESGAVECALALGFEEMRPGALGATFSDRPSPMARFFKEMVSVQELRPEGPGRGAVLRRGRRRIRQEIRHAARDLRQDRLQGPHPRAAQSLRHLQGAAQRGRGAGLAADLRAADPLPVLPAHLRRGRGHRLHAAVRRQARDQGRGGDQGQAMTTDGRAPSTNTR
jgi:hypothetical protein